MGRKDVSQRNVDQIDVSLLVTRGRREEAVEGVERALSALREAMGVGCDFPIQLADTRLPRVNPAVDKDQMVALALARRGELVQAFAASEVTSLQITPRKPILFP